MLVSYLAVLPTNLAPAAPAGFVESTIPLDAPPVGLAFGGGGVLYALEGAPFGSNVATLREYFSDGTFGSSFPVTSDDSDNFFVGSMAFDPVGERLLISDNTGDGRLYAVSKTGMQETLATGIAGIAGIAVRGTGEIFVSTSPFGSAGEVLQFDRTTGGTSPVLGGLGFGAGLAFDSAGNLVVQDADSSTFAGRLQGLPITAGPSGLEFGTPVPLIEGMQSGAGVAIVGADDFFTTGSGGLYRVAGSPIVEMPFDDNGSASQFATAIAFDPGSLPFEAFAGPDSGRLAHLADFGFTNQDSFITLITPARPGDYNLDDNVDEADYAAWQTSFGSTENLAADGSGNRVIDAADYVIWRKNRDVFVASLSAPSRRAAPEPMTLVQFVLAIPAIAFNRRRERKPERAVKLVRNRARPRG